MKYTLCCLFHQRCIW